jgi:hypothetical protein
MGGDLSSGDLCVCQHGVCRSDFCARHRTHSFWPGRKARCSYPIPFSSLCPNLQADC